MDYVFKKVEHESFADYVANVVVGQVIRIRGDTY